MYMNNDIQYNIPDALSKFCQGEFEIIFIETIHNSIIVG